MSATYTVHARRWELGWELDIEGQGVTQSRTLRRAADQVRDYVSTLHDSDESDAVVHLVVDELDELNDEVVQVREQLAQLAEFQRAAAERSRALAKALKARGLSGADTAAVLEVSEQRVSQLTRAAS